jgi:DNA-binding transcriptional LysR family regulator
MQLYGLSPVSRDFDLLKSLEIFVSVADTGNMTAAAARLHVTQSAISQQIKMLETNLGAPLFYRDARPLRLTPAGLLLRNRASALLIDARQMQSEVRRAADGHPSHIRIALLSTFAKRLVPVLLRAVKNKELAVDTLTITRGMTINHAQDLANRDVDVAFTSDAFDDMPGLQRIELLRESYLLVTPRGMTGKITDLRELPNGLPFLRHTARTQSGRRIEAHLRRLRLDFVPSSSFEFSSDLVAAIAGGYGWSLVSPSQLLEPLEAKTAIDIHPMPKPGLHRTIAMVWRAGEMSDTVPQLAALCSTALTQDVKQRLRTLSPRLEAHFEVLHAGRSPEVEDESPTSA